MAGGNTNNMKILIATGKPFAPIATMKIKKVFDKAGKDYELHWLENYTDRNDFLRAVSGADALIVRSDKVDARVFEAAASLKIVVRAGAGYDNIDLDAATAGEVVVMNTPGQNSNAVAELAVGMMIYLNRNGFNGTTGSELRGKTIGIHAYGYVGRLVASITKGFGMKVHAYDPFIDQVIMEHDGLTVEKNPSDLYSKCQYISLHIPLCEETRESVNYNLLRLMPTGATLVNTARKEVIHEPSLLKIFEERSDFRYISDILPDCKEQITENYEGRYFFTPKKAGAQTAEANNNAGIAAAKQIIAFFEKGDITFQVNKCDSV